MTYNKFAYSMSLPGAGPFPGVIDMFGTLGGCVEYRAALLATRGIAALALGFFNYLDLPKTLDDVPFEYFEVSLSCQSNIFSLKVSF